MNKEQLEQLSDNQISTRIEFIKLASEYIQAKGITRSGNLFFVDIGGELDVTVTRGDYCNNPSDIMPLVLEAGISLATEKDEDGDCHAFLPNSHFCGLYIESTNEVHLSYSHSCEHKNPYRAAAIVWLLMQE